MHIDRTAPASAVTTLPATTTETKFTVQWSGNDDRSGVRWYDVQYRDGEHGEWTDWQVNVTQVAAIFSGQAGHTYYFRSRTMDKAGNWEAYPAGEGDTYTKVDPAAAADSSWWDTAYTFKHNLLILNNDSNGLPSGYPTHLHFDNSTTPTASQLYNASESTTPGDDFRIVYNNQTELPRFVQTFTSERIDIWFNLESGIEPNPASDDTSYQLYYGNPGASDPPGDINTVMSPDTDGNTLGLWHLSEGSGTSLVDSSGNGHTGSASNMGWVEGKFGWAGEFNGTNSLVNLGSSASFNTPNVSLEAWVYPTKIKGGGEQTILRKSADDGSLIYDFIIQEDGVYLRLNGNNGYVRSNTELEENRWYHIVGTYDGSSIKVYINGNLANSVSYSLPLRYGTSTNLYLGGDGQYDNKYFHGHIQHARLSNTARTSFPYGGFAEILNEPTVDTGDAREQPQPGTPDLVVDNLTTYNTPDGTLVQAVVTNRGDGATGSGFWTDLYANHQPTGAGDFTGSIRYWVASPIEAGTPVTLTTLISDTQALSTETALLVNNQMPALQETTNTLYIQADSEGSVSEADKNNNVSSGVEVCLASADAFEADSTPASATLTSTDGIAQSHNFHVVGDKDWFKFTASAGATYTIRTGDLGLSADTYVYLYDTNGTTLLASNDDYDGTLASQHEWLAPADGTYYVMVRHWNPNVGGCGTNYNISIRQKLLGDVDGNCVVDVDDLTSLAGKWRMTSDHPDWKDKYDFDGDKEVTVIDLQALQDHWNESCP